MKQARWLKMTRNLFQMMRVCSMVILSYLDADLSHGVNINNFGSSAAVAAACCYNMSLALDPKIGSKISTGRPSLETLTLTGCMHKRPPRPQTAALQALAFPMAYPWPWHTSRLADVVCVTLASAICAHEFMGTILQHVVRAAAVVAGPGP